MTYCLEDRAKVKTDLKLSHLQYQLQLRNNCVNFFPSVLLKVATKARFAQFYIPVPKRGTGFSDMDAGMWLVSAFFKIEYWNFQDKLLLWFREDSQNLSLFRQLFFSWIPMGDQRKNAEKLPKLYIVFFSIFPRSFWMTLYIIFEK